jgi:hypothetical protein
MPNTLAERGTVPTYSRGVSASVSSPFVKGHIPDARLQELVGKDVPPETSELQHLAKCAQCFDLMRYLLMESVADGDEPKS